MSNAINAAGSPVAPGPLSGAGLVSGPAKLLRAAVYIDGFNLYHAIHDLNEPHLKWLNLWALSEALIRKRKDALVRVVWCTAEFTNNFDKMKRHQAYRKALTSVGVVAVLGHFVSESQTCRATCRQQYWKDTEKQGDVNVAISLISDAYDNVFDVAYLVTADSDQAATAKMLKAKFPQKELISVAPPNRSHSKHIRDLSDDSRAIEKRALELCLFPKNVAKSGAWVCDRPPRYDPPPGWKRPV